MSDISTLRMPLKAAGCLTCLLALCWSEASAQDLQPAPPEGPLTFGAYYYPWYRVREGDSGRGWMKRALRGRLQPRQMPRLGVYNSRDPETIRQHIAQSVHAGISFWAVSWWGPRDRNEATFRRGILGHPDAANLKLPPSTSGMKIPRSSQLEETQGLRAEMIPNRDSTTRKGIATPTTALSISIS